MLATYDDILAALPRVHAVLKPTLVYQRPRLSELTGCRFFLKHENHQPVGAFKVRGGVNVLSSLRNEERAIAILSEGNAPANVP